MPADHITIRPIDVSPVPRLSLREAEAAEALGVSASWLRREALAGRVPSALVAGVRLYPTAALSAWLAEQIEQIEQAQAAEQ
ncbi:helix-turn-helix domain-containing protein [Planctomycetales bacterium ZRK34]|nr:helix-turn-helix domain-containing protein [Planctomycetales bacterium ZRK34]